MEATTLTEAATGEDIRPFTIDVPEEQLDDLRRRITATKWPDREVDPSQGVQLDVDPGAGRYWATDYDWRAFEERFAALPHFVTEIDGVDIHFIHVRSEHEDALPLDRHARMAGLDGRATEDHRPAHQAHRTRRDARPTRSTSSSRRCPATGSPGSRPRPAGTPIRIARAWVELMSRLGYTRYVAQGGDWGNAVTEQMALLKPPGLLGIHTNMPATVPPDVSTGARRSASRRRRACPPTRQTAYEMLDHFFKTGVGYANEMANRPQTLYGIADSPVGLAAWMLDHDVRSYELIARAFAGQPGRPLPRRRPRQRHPLLADQHGDLLGAALLGEQAGLLRRQGRRDPGRRDRLPRRAVSRAAELGGAGVPQARPLQQGRRGRPLRRLGAAADLLSTEMRATFRSLR